MSFELSWEARGVVIRFAGSIGIRDIVNATVDYAKDWRFDDLKYVIADYSGIDECTAVASDIDHVWAIDMGAKRSNGRLRKAIVTTSADVVAMARRYDAAPDPAFPVRVFSSEADARAWLHG